MNTVTFYDEVEYEFTAVEPDGSTYTFLAYALPTGEVRVPYDTCNDGWFSALDEVQANGLAVISEYAATGRSFSWSGEELQQSITESAGEFGRDAVPSSLHKWIKNN